MSSVRGGVSDKQFTDVEVKQWTGQATPRALWTAVHTDGRDAPHEGVWQAPGEFDRKNLTLRFYLSQLTLQPDAQVVDFQCLEISRYGARYIQDAIRSAIVSF